MQSVADRAGSGRWYLSDVLDEVGLIDREHLRYVYYAGLKETGFAFIKRYIAGRFGGLSPYGGQWL